MPRQLLTFVYEVKTSKTELAKGDKMDKGPTFYPAHR